MKAGESIDNKDLKTDNNYTSHDTKSEQNESKTAAQYAEEVRKWLHQAYQWQCFSAYFPYVLMNQHALQTQQGQTTTNASVNQNLFPPFPGLGLALGVGGQTPNYGPGNQAVPVVAAVVARQPVLQGQVNIQQPAGQGTSERGVEYRIPPLWKRFAAEFLDFLLLLFLKLVVTFLAVEFFEVINIEKYDFDVLQSDVKTNYNLALEITSEIIMLELVHRLVVCIFEAMCLHRGTGTEGGATPGKSIVGLKVVLCDRIVATTEGKAMIYPAKDLGVWWALCRSFIKNFSLAIFFPICFTFFFFQHNRTVYDILCHSVVVEDNRRRN